MVRSFKYSDAIKVARFSGPLHKVHRTKKKKYHAVLTNEHLFMYHNNTKTSEKYITQSKDIIPLRGEGLLVHAKSAEENTTIFSLNFLTHLDGRKNKSQLYVS